MGLLRKIFGSQNDRELKKLWPIVDKINSFKEAVSSLSDSELKAKTPFFKEQIALKKKETAPILDEYRNQLSQMTSQEAKDKLKIKIRDLYNKIFEDILPEAFAVVREVAKRTINMRHFDVQLIGGLVLHEGKIAEMATGEGKTLAATLPAYLNALTGEGVHVITVNDYLAKRDREWMGPIYEFLGLSIGVIQHDMRTEEKKAQYACDITYGTNNEFGFDYLRDNLVVSKEDIVQKRLKYAIVDEVDSILIDEARTPLIISGPIDTINTAFMENRPVVEHITKIQKFLIETYIKRLKENLTQNNEEEAKKILYIVHKGSPKERDLLDLVLKDSKVKGLFDRAVTYYDSKMMEQERMELLENLYFTFEERTREVNFTAKGEDTMKEKFGIEFYIEDIEAKISEVSTNESLTEDEKIKEEEELTRAYVEQQKRLDSIKQLLKAYKLFEKDVSYVIKDNKILIVDEFTGRLMPGRRFSDGIHEAIEAKERVEVQQETQTHATITLQNYFKMYEKLSGMTGTAETEAGEFDKIYSLGVVIIPPNKSLRRENLPDIIYKTEKEKFKAICDKIGQLYEEKRPVLVGTISIEKSEVLGRLLKNRGIPHNVLNAKYHEMEAHIVAQAGSLGTVTIATNMAGRGTDILLGGNPEHLANDAVNRLGIENREEREEVYKKYLTEYKGKVNDAHNKVVELGGLFVIGTERHEARRIDNQLRGRSGRQGDPGSSSFYLSLEDDLMRIFGSDRIKLIMDKLGMEEGQEIQHPLVSRAISTAQNRVEMQNAAIRQHILKYDNVMNQQREMVYERRRAIIKGTDLKEEVFNTLGIVLENWLEGFDKDDEGVSMENFRKKLLLKLVIPFKEDELAGLSKEELFDKVYNAAKEHYEKKEKIIGNQKMRHIEGIIMLSTIDVNWKDYLFNIDQLREGINWRAYGQRDPLIEYQHEAFAMFKDLIQTIDEEIVEKLYKSYEVEEKMANRVFNVDKEQFIHEGFSSLQRPPQGPEGYVPKSDMGMPQETYTRKNPKVGRNDPCPCGSGKKYKKCCGM